MGKVLHDLGSGGGQHLYLWNSIKCSFPGKHLVWIRDLGDDPQDQADLCGLQPQGGPLFSGDEAALRHNRAVGVPTFGGG